MPASAEHGRMSELLRRVLPLVSLAVLLGCSRAPTGPSPEYQTAMGAYEKAVSATLDTTYQHPDFAAVALLLEQVPEANEREYRKAAQLAAVIRQAQAEVAKRDASLESARSHEGALGSPANAAPAYNPMGGHVEPLPSAPFDEPGAADDRSSFNDAARRARYGNARREAVRVVERHSQKEAEVRQRMKERLQEKMNERMNEPLDEGNWKIKPGTGGRRIETRVEVRREEVEE